MIEVLSRNIIQRDILERIGEAGFHSLMCDEVMTLNDDYMFLCFRYVDKDKLIREDFVEFLHIHSIKAHVLFAAIKLFYRTHALLMKQNRGQCYDRASNMSGIKAGLATLVQEEAPKAFYWHCNSHQLNLSIAGKFVVCVFSFKNYFRCPTYPDQ